MSKPSERRRQVATPWPKCEYLFHTSTGSRACRWDAMFSVIELDSMTIRLACTGHLSDVVIQQAAIPYDCMEDDNPVIVRQLSEGSPGWPSPST